MGITAFIAALANSNGVAEIAMKIIDYQLEYGMATLLLWLVPAFVYWLFSMRENDKTHSITEVNHLMDSIAKDGRYEVKRKGGFDDDFQAEAYKNMKLLDEVDKKRRKF